MNCPICHQATFVLRKDGAERRRRCTGCGYRFTTTEVLKADQERQARIRDDAVALAERIKAEA